MQRLRLLVDVLVPVSGIRVIAQPLRRAGSPLLLDRLEHVRHVARIVAGPGHDVAAQDVGLLLVLAREAEKRGADADLRSRRDHLAQSAADDRSEDLTGDLADRVRRGFRLLRRPVTQRHVAQLVRHHADDFPFAVRLFDHAAIDVHRAAGERERVDLADVDAGKRVMELGMTELGRNVLDDPLPEPVEVAVDLVVVHDRQLLLDLPRRLLSEPHVVGRAELVPWRDDPRLRRRADHQRGQRGRHDRRACANF